MEETYLTERLTLTKFSLADIDDVSAMFEDQELNVTSGLKLPTSNPERILALTMLSKTPSSVVYILRDKQAKAVVGLVVFYRMYLMDYQYSNRECEIGFVLRRESRQQGLMSEALTKLIAAYFDETKFTVLYAGVHTNNLASKAALNRMEFEPCELPNNLNENQFNLELDYFCLLQPK